MMKDRYEGGPGASTVLHGLARRRRSGWGVQLLVVLLLVYVGDSAMADDPLIEVWRAHRESFKSLEVEM